MGCFRNERGSITLAWQVPCDCYICNSTRSIACTSCCAQLLIGFSMLEMLDMVLLFNVQCWTLMSRVCVPTVCDTILRAWLLSGLYVNSVLVLMDHDPCTDVLANQQIQQLIQSHSLYIPRQATRLFRFISVNLSQSIVDLPNYWVEKLIREGNQPLPRELPRVRGVTSWMSNYLLCERMALTPTFTTICCYHYASFTFSRSARRLRFELPLLLVKA